jgi:hypothetical protein
MWYDTKKELYTKIIDNYIEPLIWFFDYYRNNRFLMYSENEEPQITFIILYKNNHNYFIDIGYVFHYSDNDGYGVYDYGYSYKIERTINLENDIYNKMYMIIIEHFGSIHIEYDFINKCDFNNDSSYYDDYTIINKEDEFIIYKIYSDDIFFINNIEKNNFVNTYIEYYNILESNNKT